MTAVEYRQALDALPYGKRLPGAVYLLDPGVDSAAIPSSLWISVAELRKRLVIGPEFNLLKFHTASPKISFLAYPDFEKHPHPVLAEAVIVDLITGKTRRDNYRYRANPPILHRKETFLPAGHALHAKFAKLTRQEEEAGLLEDTARIGFRLNWERTLSEKGLGFKGHRLVETAVTTPATPAASKKKIHRHKTALVRREISKPVKTLLELGQLRRGESFFDYGCGHGGDVLAIEKLGHLSNGWDPVHAPDEPKQAADVVNLGFVLNVIEDPAERVEAVLDAWQHTRRALLVSTLIAGQEAYDDVLTFGDGVLTSRDTFQKFFEPAEIQALLEDTLHTEAVPVGLGIYLVFRDTAELHDFLASRARRFIDWESLSRKLGLLRALKAKRDPYDTHRELLDAFWESVLELGRMPRDEEFDRLAEIRQACGSLPRALQLFIDRFGEPTFNAARQRRKEDLLVFIAAAQLRRKIPFNQLSLRLQRDLRSFFGSYANAEEKARELMFAAGDEDELEIAAAQLDFGYLDPREGHFTIHRSLLDELPVILRVYVECAARLYGNPREADLIKIHLHWTNDDVWMFLTQVKNPWGYNNADLLGMYAGASADGECPLVVDTSTPSCGDSRFGCWVCTLVEKDKSMTAMIQNDVEKEWMLPLLELRNRLDFRMMGEGDEESSDRHLRDFRRMSGAVHLMQSGRVVPGPYLQTAREDWLRQLLAAQTWIRKHGPEDVRDIELITLEELQEIRRIWVVEKHEMEDSLPRIYEEVTGSSYPGPRLDDSMAIHAGDLALLREACGEDGLHYELTRELLGITRQVRGSQRRSGHFERMERAFGKHYYDDEKDALAVAQEKSRRRAGEEPVAMMVKEQEAGA